MMKDKAALRLKKFLISPDQKRFSDIFDSAFLLNKGYLIYLRQKGYRLPLDMYSQETAVDDLSLDILGSLFRSGPKGPFHIIFDFYHSCNVAVFESADPVRLWGLFEKLLKGFTHQELSRIKKQSDPQIEILKRRFKDILKDDIYVGKVRGYAEYIHLSDREPNFDRTIIPYGELRSIAEQAFAHSTNRKQWCRKVFEMLGENPEYCGAVPRCELLQAVISVNASFLEIPEFSPRSLPDPEKSAIREAVADAKEETLQHIEEKVIQPFVVKKRIAAADAHLYVKACGRYLDDFGHDGESDAIPAYFREVMPAAYADKYLIDFKYVFETVLKGAREEFIVRMKKNPIIRQSGDYWDIQG